SDQWVCKSVLAYASETTKLGVLDCGQEFTLVLTSDVPTFQTPTKQPRQRAIRGRETFIQPHTYMWFHTESCLGDGDITFSTGAGVGEQEERYVLRTFQCWNMPDWIFSFDNVNTIYVDDGIVLSVEYSSEPGGSKNPTKVAKGDNIVVLTSGRADDVQNLKGRTDNRAYIQIGNKDNADVSMDMMINLDKDNSGSVAVQKAYAGTTYNYYNGTRTENFNTGYFEVRWEPSGKDAPEIWNSQDHIDIDIWIAPKTDRTPPTTTTKTTTPSPTSAAATTKAPKPAGDDPYCKCGVDKFGFPAGWKYNDIWLDVVVILDTSEAMDASSLADATGLVESFIGDANDNVDFLITDTTAPFYSRVGVIAMADTAQVLYNLNMTKTDKVQAAIKKGVAQINVVDAFNAAQKMLSDNPSKVGARQVIYYLTDTDPTNNLSPLYQFKTTGVVIVNNFLQAGELEKDGLKELASYGYYYSDTNYMLTLQSFCKANCFCNPGKDALAGTDPATPSSGGCYHPSSAAVPFSKAKSTCAADGGIIAVIHDDDKGRFVQQQMAKTGTKSDYYWIGYEKSGDNIWRRRTRTRTGTWIPVPVRVRGCQVGFPYVCEFPPCAVGNKSC
ncbi:hypothetical protein PRIPAC_79502, partial [Pristionchus pacificus]